VASIITASTEISECRPIYVSELVYTPDSGKLSSSSKVVDGP